MSNSTRCQMYEPSVCIKQGTLVSLRFESGSFLKMCHPCKTRRLQKYPELERYQGRRAQERKASSNESGL